MATTTREIGLVSCTKQKLDQAAVPRELYMPSAYFRKASDYAERHHDEWYILSAKHHLLHPDDPPIEPYDTTLTGESRARKREWSRAVHGALERRDCLRPGTRFVFHAGRDYYDELVPLLPSADVEIEIPTEGLRFGETLSWYNDQC